MITKKDSQKYFEGIGRRKTSSARVRIYPGESGFSVNKIELNKYFKTITQTKAASSIMQTKQVAFANGQVVVRDYMDSFPFEYYVLLRSIQQLPDVLSSALRQWMEQP